MTNTKIFQIYFKQDQVANLDPAFIPYDNTANLNSELREWASWDQIFNTHHFESNELIGVVSWKFKEKTNLTGAQVLAFIADKPGYDVYLFNPCIVNEAVFANGWEQGDRHHPNISEIGNSFLHKIGYADIDVRGVLLDRNRTVFANYVVGNQRFWDGFMMFSRQLFTEANNDAEFNHLVFGAGLSNYAHDNTLPNFTFLIERLLPTYLELTDAKVMPYQYTADTAPSKYAPYLNDINALSELKVQINKHDSDELYAIWDHYRRKLLITNPEILNLE